MYVDLNGKRQDFGKKTIAALVTALVVVAGIAVWELWPRAQAYLGQPVQQRVNRPITAPTNRPTVDDDVVAPGRLDPGDSRYQRVAPGRLDPGDSRYQRGSYDEVIKAWHKHINEQAGCPEGTFYAWGTRSCKTVQNNVQCPSGSYWDVDEQTCIGVETH